MFIEIEIVGYCKEVLNCNFLFGVVFVLLFGNGGGCVWVKLFVCY